MACPWSIQPTARQPAVLSPPPLLPHPTSSQITSTPSLTTVHIPQIQTSPPLIHFQPRAAQILSTISSATAAFCTTNIEYPLHPRVHTNYLLLRWNTNCLVCGCQWSAASVAQSNHQTYQHNYFWVEAAVVGHRGEATVTSSTANILVCSCTSLPECTPLPDAWQVATLAPDNMYCYVCPLQEDVHGVKETFFNGNERHHIKMM